MRRSPGKPLRPGIWLLAALGLSLAGCHYRYDFNGALIALPKAQQIVHTTPNVDVVLVAEDGTVFPKELLIRPKTYAVVWVTSGKSLNVTFDDPSVKPTCGPDLPICILGPLDLPYAAYGYGGQVTDKDGFPHRLDPKIEIVR